jgi:hypothetical protein
MMQKYPGNKQETDRIRIRNHVVPTDPEHCKIPRLQDCKILKSPKLCNSVADPHHFAADPDPPCHFDADPDPRFHFNADPHPDPTFQIKAHNL